jgi:hypothetical protein
MTGNNKFHPAGGGGAVAPGVMIVMGVAVGVGVAAAGQENSFVRPISSNDKSPESLAVNDK